MNRKTRLKITDLNPNLSCVLCGGYYVDATTIMECLHSFCRTCIVQYLSGNKYCPICDSMVHKTKPLLSLRSDKTLQDLVYKLVPGLYKSEMKRRRDFYARNPSGVIATPPPCSEARGMEAPERVIYTVDECISMSLELSTCGASRSPAKIEENSNNEVDKEEHPVRYLLCPAGVNVSHLKKFIRMKYDLSSIYLVDVFHSDETLKDDYTLMDIAYIYTWRRREPLRLFYCIYVTRETPEKQATAVQERECASMKNDKAVGGKYSTKSETTSRQYQVKPNSGIEYKNSDPVKTNDEQVYRNSAETVKLTSRKDDKSKQNENGSEKTKVKATPKNNKSKSKSVVATPKDCFGKDVKVVQKGSPLNKPDENGAVAKGGNPTNSQSNPNSQTNQHVSIQKECVLGGARVKDTALSKEEVAKQRASCGDRLNSQETCNNKVHKSKLIDGKEANSKIKLPINGNNLEGKATAVPKEEKVKVKYPAKVETPKQKAMKTDSRPTTSTTCKLNGHKGDMPPHLVHPHNVQSLVATPEDLSLKRQYPMEETLSKKRMMAEEIAMKRRMSSEEFPASKKKITAEDLSQRKRVTDSPSSSQGKENLLNLK